MSLRILPNLTVIRPADATETKWAWITALENKTGPTALLLTRQNLPIFDRNEGQSSHSSRYLNARTDPIVADPIVADPIVGAPIVVASACHLKRGAYILWENADSGHDLLLLASGSEVTLALEAGQKIAAEGKKVRVVSFPSWELFEKQDAAYRAAVLPAGCVCRLAVEAGVTSGWEKYVGSQGRIIGINHFGASGPFGRLAKEFGFTADHVYEVAQDMLS